MGKAVYWLELDTYYQNSQSLFFGPYATEAQARQHAVLHDASDGNRQLSDNVRYGTRFFVLNTAQARKAGRKDWNTYPADKALPNNTDEHAAMLQAASNTRQ